jgi:hypothetical protein
MPYTTRGVINPDILWTNKDALQFITDFSKQENRSQQFAMGHKFN